MYSGDLLSSDGGNNIPAMAIVFAVVSSFNSVGVSIYQEQLFKVKKNTFNLCKHGFLIMPLSELWGKLSRAAVLVVSLWHGRGGDGPRGLRP